MSPGEKLRYEALLMALRYVNDTGVTSTSNRVVEIAEEFTEYLKNGKPSK